MGAERAAVHHSILIRLEKKKTCNGQREWWCCTLTWADCTPHSAANTTGLAVREIRKVRCWPDECGEPKFLFKPPHPVVVADKLTAKQWKTRKSQTEKKTRKTK